MNIKLVKYLESDFDLFKTMVSDDETVKYIAGDGWTESQAKVHFDAMIETNREDGQFCEKFILKTRSVD